MRGEEAIISKNEDSMNELLSKRERDIKKEELKEKAFLEKFQPLIDALEMTLNRDVLYNFVNSAEEASIEMIRDKDLKRLAKSLGFDSKHGDISLPGFHKISIFELYERTPTLSKFLERLRVMDYTIQWATGLREDESFLGRHFGVVTYSLYIG